MILQPEISVVRAVSNQGEIIRESLAEAVEKLEQAVFASVGAATIPLAVEILYRLFSGRAMSRFTTVR
jgi:hypothetical protein